MANKAGHRGFGYLRRLPSKRWQATYAGPDRARHSALETFQTKGDAEAWLAREQSAIAAGTWVAPKDRRAAAEPEVTTLADYAQSWLARRDLKPRTRQHYRQLLDRAILPTLGNLPLTSLTPRLVADWHHGLDAIRKTWRAHAYGLLRTILATAVVEQEIPANPAQIRRAGVTRRQRKIEPGTLAEIEAITAAMPQKYRPMVLLSAWCALRFGEVTEIRRKDLDLRRGVVHVRRGVTRPCGEPVVGTPKSHAGTRDVAIPPHLVPMLREHLESMPMRGPDALIFPAADGVSHLAPSTLYRVYYPARKAAGRPDLRWHDLRHTGATLAAQTGATLAELMGRLGHSTPGAALLYQHQAAGRDAQIAAALSQLAGEQ